MEIVWAHRENNTPLFLGFVTHLGDVFREAWKNAISQPTRLLHYIDPKVPISLVLNIYKLERISVLVCLLLAMNVVRFINALYSYLWQSFSSAGMNSDCQNFTLISRYNHRQWHKSSLDHTSHFRSLSINFYFFETGKFIFNIQVKSSTWIELQPYLQNPMIQCLQWI